MGSISNTEELRDYIELLETEQRVRGDELKMQFLITYREFKPYSLLAKVVKGAIPASSISDKILTGGLSLASGLLVRKMVVGKSAGLVRRLAGTAMQAGTSGLVAQNIDLIKGIGRFLFGILTARTKEK
jgi:hypothetical protein